jgi:PAS domain-containing protein
MVVETGHDPACAGWAPMARDLATVAGILDDLPYPAHLNAVDPERTYPWVAANAAALEAIGLSRVEAMGRPAAEIISDPEAVAEMRRRRDEVVDRQVPVKCELAVSLPSGRRRFDTTLVPIRAADGRCSHVFAVWNDATVLRESEARLRTAAEAGDKGFAILESVRDEAGQIADFRFVWANVKCRQRLSADGTPLVGRNLSEVIPVPEMREGIERYAEVVRTGEMIELEFPERLAHRGDRWLNQQIARVGDGIAITTNDITDRRLAEHEIAHRTEVERLMCG